MTKGKLCLAAAYMTIGSAAVCAQYVTGTLQPFTIAFISLTFAIVSSFLVRWRTFWSELRSIRRRHWKYLLVQGIMGMFLYRLFLTFGLRYTSAAEAGIFTGAAPAFTALMTRFFLKEPLRRRAIAGICITLLGVLVLQGFPFQIASFEWSHILGNLLVLGVPVCDAAFTTVSRKMYLEDLEGQESFSLHPATHIGLVCAMAAVLSFVPMLLERPFDALRTLPVGGWVALLWYGCIVTVAATIFLLWGTKVCDGYTIAAFSGLTPLSSMVLSILILGESVALYQVAGCACIIAAILVMNKKTPAPAVAG